MVFDLNSSVNSHLNSSHRTSVKWGLEKSPPYKGAFQVTRFQVMKISGSAAKAALSAAVARMTTPNDTALTAIEQHGVQA